MIDIEKIENIDDKKHIALLDTSSISFMQGLKMKGIQPEDILSNFNIFCKWRSKELLLSILLFSNLSRVGREMSAFAAKDTFV